ncbi:FHA domain-containing protein [Stigmatella aurantiaca]|uniref:FHA domain protein n=1 Tax=Stigmatella aurantiaca (strain DW4/3-1) TaxID=378806 RepID=E3FZQ4_STIAD|nr:FHA domain-containing protein [Stigmatella aurantiaca]ADO69919.1 FHA domain protein [Stigmatella aurantiaca DW4/3-1]
MGFQLKIAEGKDAGKEFQFEHEEVLIGRTPECDVVLYDAGISRKHCRIFSLGERYFVEDMGSSNGTKVNGAPIKKQPLSDGDQIGLGPVVFSFEALASDPGEEPNTDAGEDAPPNNDPSTRIVSLEEVKQRRSKREVLKPEGADAEPERLDKIQRSATRAGIPAIRATPRAPTGSGSRVAVERSAAPPSTPARRGAGAVERASSSRGASPPAALSAAERARIKRASGSIAAQLKIFWIEANTWTRRGVIAVMVLLGLSVVGLAYWLVLDSGRNAKAGAEEPLVLSAQPIEDSFGLGPDVTWDRPDLKSFTWEYTAATRAVVILHFQAQGISQGELVVTVNGLDVGQVPADTLTSRDRSLEIMIPPNVLKKGEINRFTFDNTKNPPGEDTWRIWNVWVEKALLPELPPDQLVREARNAYARGKLNIDRADVGARNRYLAWKSFREAWLMLEAHPEPKPDLYFEAKDRMGDAQQELDRTCSKLLLEAEGYYNQRNYKAAKHTLQHIREYFPEFDQPCAIKSENKLLEYNL